MGFQMELYEAARMYALAAHGDQKYGAYPYSFHLAMVHDVLIEFGHTDPILRAAAYLHDVVEDADIPLKVLLEVGFPESVVNIVDGVTSVDGPNRKTRNTASYPRIAESIERIKVKLADRLANMRHSKSTKNSLFDMYNREYPEFRAALYTSDPSVAPMWAELDQLAEWSLTSN